ncbi:hypothetical protein OE88DRAFT_544071 [Heliocybe sulcata]|uniref:BTB domain-containing protein n=1 Tax=Heliocybe sulcata TaxID=5364 RepID=A0A5C3N495_9AGAM|nr:hypothetical protein OE88DRAFT_544071 [Heliocybe sulcata]
MYVRKYQQELYQGYRWSLTPAASCSPHVRRHLIYAYVWQPALQAILHVFSHPLLPLMSSADECALSRKVAAAPFDKPNADVILRSRDHVDFHVHKAILSIASSFFETMFTLPLPHEVDTTVSGEGGGQSVVQMAEESRTLELLLRFCYPVDRPQLEMADIFSLLAVARKYDMAWLTSQLQAMLPLLMDKDPVTAYAIVYQYQLSEEARSAATLALRLGQPELFAPRPILMLVPADGYARLLRYHHECGQAVSKLDPAHAGFAPWLPRQPDLRSLLCNTTRWKTERSLFTNETSRRNVHSWFIDLIQKACLALSRCPSTSILQPIYSELLEQAASCAHCHATAVHDSQHLREVFVARVEAAISEVSLDLPF